MRRFAAHLALAAVLLAPLAPRGAAAAPAIEARIARSRAVVGEPVGLDLVVGGVSGGISEPDLILPSGVEIIATSRSTNFSWVNGRSSSETVFHYEIAATAPGRYTLGPFRVQIGGQTYQSGEMALTVTGEPPVGPGGAAGGAPASILTDVNPRTPWAGEPVVLRVRLVQRAPLVEDPIYTPPPTPGFWAERFSEPESYYALEGGQRVLVTETRARLYPLSPGRATVGEAAATLVLAQGPVDPLGWIGGGARRQAVVKSPAVEVSVRALPAGAPAGFDGGVGTLQVTWSADRPRTTEDVPITVRLDVRGVGNLPLLHTPPLASDDFEVFSGTIQDSLAAAGSLAPGRRRFVWTVLPRHRGTCTIAPPAFAWFDPAGGAYRRLEAPALSIEIAPALSGKSPGAEGFPAVFRGHAADPGARTAKPWAWALAGLLLGVASVVWSAGRRRAVPEADVARQKEWLRAVGMAQGPDFWHAADQAAGWLAARGTEVGSLPSQIAAARYGGGLENPDRVRRRLVELLGSSVAASRPALVAPALAVTLALGALVFAWLTGPQPGEPSTRRRAEQADADAVSGAVERAAREWRALWEAGQRAPSLAARLAWASIRSGDVAQAALWTLRGARGEPRDPALGWVRDRVREAGALAGEGNGRWPLRSPEWGALGALFAFVAVRLRRRRAACALALLLAGAAALAPEIEARRGAGRDLAVTLGSVRLEDSALDLNAGQVVRIVREEGERVRVRVGRDIEGVLPREAIERVEAP